jgi:hypothetical protein
MRVAPSESELSDRQLLFGLSTWVELKDGDPTVRAIFDRHYSRTHYRDGRRPVLFVGPGFKRVMMTPCARAIWVWRRFIDACIDQRTGQPQRGVNCAVFRNEGAGRSSDLILAAERIAWRDWPGDRLYTYVDPSEVASANPGYCFICAGWKRCGYTKSGLVVFEKLPDWSSHDCKELQIITKRIKTRDC